MTFINVLKQGVKTESKLCCRKNVYTILCTARSRNLLKTGRTQIGLYIVSWIRSRVRLCTGVTVACFHSSGIEPSVRDLFMSTVTGLAIAPEPSLRRRAGISARPVDLEKWRHVGGRGESRKSSNVIRGDHFTKIRLDRPNFTLFSPKSSPPRR